MKSNRQQPLSTAALLKSSFIALVLAAISLVSFILPAEYNIDPTGIGKKLGLTVLAQTSPSPVINRAGDIKKSSGTFEVTVPSSSGIEFKFSMLKFEKMTYKWRTEGQTLEFDLHGEPEGDTTGYFESYALATLSEMKGSFTAPFTGSHGWYWYNESNSPVTVQLDVEGEYTLIGLKK